MACTTPEAHEKRPAMEAIDQVPFAERLWHSRNLSPYYLDSHRLLCKEVRQACLYFNHERLWLAGTSLRLARVCIEDICRYAKTRETFDKLLLANQTILSKFSAAGRRVEPVQALMEQLVYAHEAAMRERQEAHEADILPI